VQIESNFRTTAKTCASAHTEQFLPLNFQTSVLVSDAWKIRPPFLPRHCELQRKLSFSRNAVLSSQFIFLIVNVDGATLIGLSSKQHFYLRFLVVRFNSSNSVRDLGSPTVVSNMLVQARNQGGQGGEDSLKIFSPPPWKNMLDIIWKYRT